MLHADAPRFQSVQVISASTSELAPFGCGKARVFLAVLPAVSVPSDPMRIVLQPVSPAEVRIGRRVTGRIGRGFCLLVGFATDDKPEQLAWIADKVLSLRLFPDDEGKMNPGLDQISDNAMVAAGALHRRRACLRGGRGEEPARRNRAIAAAPRQGRMP